MQQQSPSSFIFLHRHSSPLIFLLSSPQSFFAHRCFRTEMPSHRGASTHNLVFTQKLLHTEAFAQRSLYTEELPHNLISTQKLLHTDAFTEKLFHREAFTILYTEELLHTETSPQRSLCREELLQTEVFLTFISGEGVASEISTSQFCRSF